MALVTAGVEGERGLANAGKGGGGEVVAATNAVVAGKGGVKRLVSGWGSGRGSVGSGQHDEYIVVVGCINKLNWGHQRLPSLSMGGQLCFVMIGLCVVVV